MSTRVVPAVERLGGDDIDEMIEIAKNIAHDYELLRGRRMRRWRM
jgi:hypothetical protein